MAGEESATSASAAPLDGAPSRAAGNVFDEQRRNRRDTWLLIAGFVALLGFIGFGFDLFILGAAGFWWNASNPWPVILAIPVLAFLCAYSYAKRFTWAAHAGLGLALALAPGGAWLAMGAAPSQGIVLLMVAVYAGVPAANTAIKIAKEVYADHAGEQG